MHKKMVAGGVALVAAAAIGGGAIAYAGGGDGEGDLTGPKADQATAAALEATGGGTANAVERDSEHGATWEVEVTKDDGTTVDVYLDAAYKLIVIDGDSEAADTDDASE